MSDSLAVALMALGPTSQCGICGVPGQPQRHRMVDAVVERALAGEDPEDIACDYEDWDLDPRAVVLLALGRDSSYIAPWEPNADQWAPKPRRRRKKATT